MPIQKVSVVIPARNEEATIGPVLDELNAAIARLPCYRFEILVVVDNPQDLTIGMAQARGARIVLNPRAIGKGAALATGFSQAAGDAIIIFDSDGSHNPRDIGIFLDALERGAGLVVGSRVLGGSDDHNVIRLFGNAVFTLMFSVLFGTTIMDVLNGYKAFVRDVAVGYKHKAKGFDCEIEIAARAIRQGYPLVEVATHENKRAGGKMKSRAFRDGFAIMLAVLREGLAYRAWRLCHWRKRNKQRTEDKI
jgi:glycosyltransferase involved in cell wall biosynthesis